MIVHYSAMSQKFGKQLHTNSWLWGETCQKIAQLTQISRPAKPEGICHITDTVLQGSLQFSPSNWPLLATRQGELHRRKQSVMPHGFTTIQQASQRVSQAVAANPWQTQFPMLLHNVMPIQQESNWQLTDPKGSRLPLPDKFAKGWHLAALAGGTPSLTLFGVWNGRFLRPLSVFTQNSWQDIQIWRGIR
ncbi:hypothetical protein MNBD_CHLOROFLEXI01-2309 [hydrothermal vent metagenome]|uniref:Uncharacterized protein n=1 Tax=hydrothermal vent metagenome TaxID=652676 RepID=A0A3B0VHT0_9ZZZZ